MSAGGLTLSETVEYVYLTDLAEGGENSVELTVVSIDMVQDFPPAVPQPEKLSLRETVEMGFSRPVDRDTIESFFSIDPYCPGSLIWKNDSTAVFLPDRDFIPDTVYTLQIGGEFPFSPEDGSFTTAAEMPGVHSLQGDPEDQFPENLQALPEDSILITPSGAQGAYTFFFTYDEEVPDTFIQQELQHRFRIAPLFPTDIPPPATVGYIWSGPASLVIQVNGIGTLHENRPCYYTLTLPEGSDRLRQIYVRFEP